MGKDMVLKQLAHMVCKILNDLGQGEPATYEERLVAVKRVAREFEISEEYLRDYCNDAIFWDPRYAKYRVDTLLVGCGEGDMISVRDRIGSSIRGYGRSSGGSIRWYGLFGLVRKANNFARRTKFISKGANLLGYGMDSAGFLDKAW